MTPRLCLTRLEATLVRRFASSGGPDGGYTEVARDVMTPRQIGGVVASLVKKGVVVVDAAIMENGMPRVAYHWVSEEVRGAAFAAAQTVEPAPAVLYPDAVRSALLAVVADRDGYVLSQMSPEVRKRACLALGVA